MSNTISVIVPCYNEEKRILPIIKSLKLSPSVTEIIVVDDGSDKKSQKILSHLSGIKLITHPQNLGKAKALYHGLCASQGNIVVFVDSDLIGFTPRHLQLLVNPIIKHGYDLTIGDIECILFPFKLSGYSACYSGERAFNSRLLKKYPQIFSAGGYVDGFLVEAEMNRVFFGKYKIAKVLLDGVGAHYKISKYGITGFLNDIKVMRRCLNYLGIKEELKQLKFIRSLGYLK